MTALVEAPVISALEVRDVTLGWGTRTVVADTSLQIPREELTVLVGPNGAGKSTLIQALAGLLQPQSGEVTLDGSQMSSLSRREVARGLSYLPQDPLVPAGTLVEELVTHGRHPHRGVLAGLTTVDHEAVTWALEVTGTTEFANRRVDTLSGGERRRVWLAMSIAQQTDILLLDEPTAALDIRHEAEVLALLRTLVDDHHRTVVTVLHDLNHATAIADNIAVVSDGTVSAFGPPDDVLTSSVIVAAFGIDVCMLTTDDGVRVCVPRLMG